MRISYLRSSPIALPRFAPWRPPLAAMTVVLLLSALFAGAILAARQTHPPVDIVQASVQGGL